MPSLELLKEQFSLAALRAVASAAGYTVSRPETDTQSVDFVIEGDETNTPVEHPRIETQAKCTEKDDGRPGELAFELPIKNYRDLTRRTALPRILVVVVVPSAIGTDWLKMRPFECALRCKMLWMSLQGMPPSSNTSSVTVRVPRVQCFDVDALRALMGRVANGGRK